MRDLQGEKYSTPPEEWVFSVSSAEQGSVTASMYEVTDGKSNHERKTVRVELDLSEMITLFDTLYRALSYHLRVMR